MNSQTFTSLSTPAQYFEADWQNGQIKPIFPSVVESHLITVRFLPDMDCYEAQMYPEAPLGYGPTARDAFYDLCEIIAEWGLDMRGRNYPPSWWERTKWNIENTWNRIVSRFRSEDK